MKRIRKRDRLMLRSIFVSFALIICFFIALTAMGYIFTVTEYNAYGRNAVAFYVGPDSITLFDKEIYFPVFEPLKRLYKSAKLYSPGIIKLLGMSVEVTEELLLRLSEFALS